MLYLDTEWTCWAATPPNGMQPEIIEIGIVAMDLSKLSLIREQAYFVRPRHWEVSEKRTALTGITAEDVKSARPLDQVLTLIAQEFAPVPVRAVRGETMVLRWRRNVRRSASSRPFAGPSIWRRWCSRFWWHPDR